MALRYAARVNGFTGLCITKLDVLNTLETIKVCTAYRYRGEVLKELPPAQAVFAEVEPVYEEFPGWKSDISGATSVQDLPQETIDYLNFIIRRRPRAHLADIRRAQAGAAHQGAVPNVGAGPSGGTGRRLAHATRAVVRHTRRRGEGAWLLSGWTSWWSAEALGSMRSSAPWRRAPGSGG